MPRTAPAVPIPAIGQEIEVMEGLRCWRNALNQFAVVHIHYTADPARRGDWKYRKSPKYGGLRSWRWRKEQEIDWEAKAGSLIFERFDESVHMIRPFTPPEDWPRWIMVDPGWRNPTSMIWVAIDTDADPDVEGLLPIHVYREFYQPKHSSTQLARIAHDWSSHTGTEGEQQIERVEGIIFDPQAKQEHQSAANPENVDESAATVFNQFQEEIDALGWDVPCWTGNNHKDEAITELISRVGRYWVMPDGLPLYDDKDNFREPTAEELKAGAVMRSPTIFFHESCPDGKREMKAYRWRDWASSGVAERHNEPEKPVDKDDHTMTNLIRLVNHLRELRGEQGEELELFETRFRKTRVKSVDEMLAERNSKRAQRYRQRIENRGQR